MEITSKSEWMKDQKHAVVMAPGKSFEVIQMPSGQAVYFSLGTDKIFYATREVQGSETGWNKIDLSSSVGARHVLSQTPMAKAFAVAQNLQTLFFDLAMVVRVGSTDYLYLSIGNANTDEFWKGDGGPDFRWQHIPFDSDSRDKEGVCIENVFLMNQISSGSPSGVQTCFADILQKPEGTDNFRMCDRYYVSLNEGGPRWQKRTIAIDLKVGSVLNCLGCPAGEPVGGIYTFGRLGDDSKLLFTPAYNPFDENVPPNPIRLPVSSTTSSIASAMNSQGKTLLFYSAEQGIGMFPADSKHDQAEDSTPITIHSSDLTRQASQLSAETIGGITALYGVSVDQELFYSTCPAGSEKSPENWSVPVVLVKDIQNFAFFLNKEVQNNTVFAHGHGTSMFQLTQDPVTNDWASRAILLPAADIDHVATFDAFTTRITVKEKRRTVVNHEILVTATSPIGVYINNQYRVLNATVPVKARTDASGAVKLSQPAESMTPVCYKVSLSTEPKRVSLINPARNSKDKLYAIKSVTDLNNAKIKNDDGTTSPLISSDVSEEEREATVKAIVGLSEAAATLPADGSVKDMSSSFSVPLETKELFSISREDSNGTMIINCQDSNAFVGTSSIGDFMRSGDLFQYVKTAWEHVKSATLKFVDGVCKFVVEIGGKILHTIIDCIAAVGRAIMWVFEKIKVFVEKLIRWLGFIFAWKDIVRGHNVIKNIVKQYALYGVERIGSLSTAVEKSFDNVEEKLNIWADMPSSGKAIGDIEDGAKSNNDSMDDPQANYVHDKAGDHLNETQTGDKDDDDSESGGWKEILSQLGDFASNEKDVIVRVINEIKNEILLKFRQLTITDVVKKLAVIISKFFISSAKNVIKLTLGIIKNVTAGVFEELEKPIKIPVISWLYKKISGNELSILDLICLAASCPVTIIYKAVTNENPFPDNDQTKSLIEAQDFQAVQRIITGDSALFKKYAIICEYVAMAGLFFDTIANTFKLPKMVSNEFHEVSDTLKQVSIGVKMLIIMPSYIRERSDSDAWYWKLDACMTDIAFLKTLLDASNIGEKGVYGKVSPYMDLTISAVWLVPAIGKAVENHQNKSSSYTSLTTSLGYDVAVMMAPVLWTPIGDPTTKAAVLTGANVLVMVCGAVSVATGGLKHDND